MASDLDYRLCVDASHLSGWQCARCNRTYCYSCDRMADDGRAIKTLVRWCQDWRCQREEKIERGEDETLKLKRALAEALDYAEQRDVMAEPGGWKRVDEYEARIAELRLLL